MEQSLGQAAQRWTGRVLWKVWLGKGFQGNTSTFFFGGLESLICFGKNDGTCFLWLDSWSLFAAPQVASAITSPMSTRTPSSEMSVAWDA